MPTNTKELVLYVFMIAFGLAFFVMSTVALDYEKKWITATKEKVAAKHANAAELEYCNKLHAVVGDYVEVTNLLNGESK
tara:strand:- start:255 stop:491 length:237 start_codon:yes stop_codon:yes gene_type:complete